MIVVNNLQKQYGNTHVLRGITCRIEEREVVCVIGPSGSGKSTFLRCLNGLETVSGGEVLVNGFHVEDPKTDLNKMRASVGMVFQRFNLFANMSVLDNLVLAPMQVRRMKRDEAVIVAEQLLRKVGLLDKIDAHPSQLSGGQQQRVAIARAIVSDPTLLVCDEPTGDLDRQSAEDVLGLLQQLNREHGKTIVMVTHDPKAAEYASHTLHLDKGTLVTPALA